MGALFPDYTRGKIEPSTTRSRSWVYTEISGTPVATGLYTMLLPVMAFAFIGSSRHLVVAADSAAAALGTGGLMR